MSFIYSIILFLLLSCEYTVSTGLDNLLSAKFDIIQDKNIGLIINHTSLIKKGHHIIDLLAHENRINVLKIFSPEHGYKGIQSAGEMVEDNIEPLTGGEIVSLYGKNKKPSSKELNDIDVLVYDIQDIGSRYYTYISSMAYMMDAAAENNIPFIVLDRPNPLGRKISGPILDMDYASFNAPLPIYGTDLRDNAIKNGWINEQDDNYYDGSMPTRISTDQLSPSEIKELRSLAYRKFYLRPYYFFKAIVRLRTIFQIKI